MNTKVYKKEINLPDGRVISIETYGVDVTDYLLFKEFKDKIDYTLKLREFISLTQSLIDKSNLSNHFRVTFKKIK